MATKTKSADQLTSFHREAIDVLLKFVKKYDINNIQELNAYKGRALLDVPLWKLLENDGKYGGRYISEGVYNLEKKLGVQVNKNYGIWNEKLLEKHFGKPPSGTWQKNPAYCCQLDHVSERAKLIDILLKAPKKAQEILDQCLVGCVVLKSEHSRLGSADINPEDPWRRYRESFPQLRVWDRESESWLLLKPIS